MGLAILVSSKDWWSIAIGVYFISMGVFSFGCAGGACALNPPVDKSTVTKK
jgi:hypothetical protein